MFKISLQSNIKVLCETSLEIIYFMSYMKKNEFNKILPLQTDYLTYSLLILLMFFIIFLFIHITVFEKKYYDVAPFAWTHFLDQSGHEFTRTYLSPLSKRRLKICTTIPTTYLIFTIFTIITVILIVK